MSITNSARARAAKDLQCFGTSEDWKNVCEGKGLHEALQVADGILKQGMPISRNLAYCLLQGCSKRKDLAAARLVYSFISKSNLDLVPPLGDPLIRLFASYGHLTEANTVFLSIKNPSSHTWHAIISAHIASGQHEKSLTLYHNMLDDGFQPSKFMFSCILKACACMKTLGKGMLVHDQIIESSLESDVVVGSALIDLYAKCGSLKEARKTFDELLCRNVVSWNTMIAGYAQHREGLLAWELFEKMQQDGIEPDKFTFSCILKACGINEALSQGAVVHEKFLKSGIISNTVIGNALVDMYFKCGNIKKAREVFEDLPNRDVVSWNTLIMGYTYHGLGFDALELFEKMQQEGIMPNKVTYLCLLKACCSITAVEEGKWIHNQIVISGLALDVEIGSTLVDMYAKCGSLIEARHVFDKLLNRDGVLWCTMIAAYAQNGYSPLALELYEDMQQDNVTPDKATFLCILKACVNIKAVSQGKLVHEQIVACELGFDVVVRNTLIDMYIKCDSLDEARKLFEDFPNRNVVSWDAMIAGYTQTGLGFPALELFEKMQLEGSSPDKVSFLCTLKASGSIGAIFQGRLIHDLISREGLEIDAELGNSLIDMYAKCGSLQEACRVFEVLPQRTLASWGALISGYAQQGNWRLAGQYLEHMQQEGLKPVGMIYTSMLAACSQAGQVEEGYRHFTSMTKNLGIVPSIEHYNCMIDLLGRTGRLYEAERLLRTMPISPDVFGWMSLLTACKTYGNLHLGRQCYEEIVQLDPNNSSGLTLIADLADGSNQDHIASVHEMKDCINAWKKPGRAWFEAHNELHEFIVGDKTHPRSNHIHEKLNSLRKVIKKKGYVPQMSFWSV